MFTSCSIQLFLISAGLLIVAGLGPAPGDMIGFTDQSGTFSYIRLIVFCLQLLPIAPLAFGVIRVATPFRLNHVLATLLSCVVIGVGVFLTLLDSAFAGVGSTISLFHGAAVTLALAGSVALVMKCSYQSVRIKFAMFLILVATVASLWSLRSVYSVSTQAVSLAWGQPYCLARHGDNEPIKTFAELRGFYFYSTRSGYKDSSRWYFHGVLIVDAPSPFGKTYYNWSPRHQRFDPIEKAQILVVPIDKACKPERDFLKRVGVF